MNELIESATFQKEPPLADLVARIEQLEAWGNATHKWLVTFKIEWAALSNQVRLLQQQRFAQPGSADWGRGHIEKLNERIQAVEDRVREIEGYQKTTVTTWTPATEYRAGDLIEQSGEVKRITAEH